MENKIDYAVVAPDDPLVLGCVDALEKVGVPCFGPRASAAIIEGSKVFSKNLMKKYHIPTAGYEVFDDMEAALRYLDTAPIPTVIKADGLALGKGVLIAETREDAVAAAKDKAKNDQHVNFLYPDTAPFQEAMAPLHSEVLSANPELQPVYDLIQEYNAEYTSTN